MAKLYAGNIRLAVAEIALTVRRREWSDRESRHGRLSREVTVEGRGQRPRYNFTAGGRESFRRSREAGDLVSVNGARGTRDIEGKVTRVGASELGCERVSKPSFSPLRCSSSVA